MLGRDSEGKAMWLQVSILEMTRAGRAREDPPKFRCPVHVLILDSLPLQLGGNGFLSFVFVFVCGLRTTESLHGS